MPSPSMKSDSGSERPANKWKVSRTLNRKPFYRPIEDEDIKYAWAAYKQGGLTGWEEGLSAQEFKEHFERVVTQGYHACWTLFAPTAKGSIPVGFVFAAWAPNAPFLIVDGAVWMPWASKRNIIEASVYCINDLRKHHQIQFYALPEHKRLYEVCCMHGILRRVGTSFIAIPGKSCAVFETRAKAA